MKFSWIKIIVIGAAMAVGTGAYLITRQPDSALEQAAESILESQGIDIDFSPEEE